MRRQTEGDFQIPGSDVPPDGVMPPGGAVFLGATCPSPSGWEETDRPGERKSASRACVLSVGVKGVQGFKIILMHCLD